MTCQGRSIVLTTVDVTDIYFMFFVNLDWLTWVWVNTIGVDGLRGGLTIALRREGTESIDPDLGGYARHGCSRDAWGCAGACEYLHSQLWKLQGVEIMGFILRSRSTTVVYFLLHPHKYSTTQQGRRGFLTRTSFLSVWPTKELQWCFVQIDMNSTRTKCTTSEVCQAITQIKSETGKKVALDFSQVAYIIWAYIHMLYSWGPFKSSTNRNNIELWK